jgi:hypothetical protein
MSRYLKQAVVVAIVCASHGLAQPTPDAAKIRAAGDTAIVHRNWKALVGVYEPVTRAQPENGMAWFRLGAGLNELGQLRPAANAFREAIRLQFQPGQSEYRLAEVLVKSKMLDSVLPHLASAFAAGIPVELITGNSAFAPMRGDRRYVALVDSLETRRYPCRQMPEAHHFDFWVGDWSVTNWTGATVAIGRGSENHITSELANCIIHEHWTAASGSKGESINFWDPNRRAWRQIWMDEHQWSLDYEGEFKDGAMRFHGWTLGPDGRRRLEKLTFFAISKDTVRQVFEQSADSGKTWQTTFDGRYVRMKQP